MTTRWRRLLSAALLVALITSACSSSSDGSEVATEGDAATAQTDGEAADDSASSTAEESNDSAPEATSIPVPEDDAAAGAAIAGLDSDIPPEEATADPATTAQDFVRNRFNIDADPDRVACMVTEAGQDEALDLALRTPSVGQGDVDDLELRALTQAMNGCIDSVGLGDWATQAIGPQGEVRETAPACLAERFNDTESGDLTFYSFVALTYQFRLDPAGTESLTDALATCAPITSLSEFFASTAEQQSGFETLIDRACLNDALGDPQISQEFWAIFVAGGTPPIEFISPYTDQCGTTATSDLADSLPDDFVPWSGVRSLAGVAPSARANAYSAPPPMTIDPEASYRAVISTGGAEIRIDLFADSAPITVNNFVNLARDGYYDGTVFHRVLADFMAQGGDPTGTGTGGPGYQFEDEVDGGPALDRKGLLAMANAGPGTNGSQFFITFVPTEWLTGNHTVFGEVTEGIEIVEAIELRDPGAAASRGQVIDSILIIEN